MCPLCQDCPQSSRPCLLAIWIPPSQMVLSWVLLSKSLDSPSQEAVNLDWYHPAPGQHCLTQNISCPFTMETYLFQGQCASCHCPHGDLVPTCPFSEDMYVNLLQLPHQGLLPLLHMSTRGWGQIAVRPATVLLLMSGLRHIQNKLVGSLLLNPHQLAPPPKCPSYVSFCPLDFSSCVGQSKRQGLSL
jgi:hypothetical protein